MSILSHGNENVIAHNGKTGNNIAGNTIASNTVALLGAFCFFLAAVEYMIPKPLPFLRLGLANLPLMLALDIFSFRQFLFLVFLKITGQALITGTLFSYVFLFSLAGTLLSALLMWFLRRIFEKKISFAGVGTAGAFISNAAQLFIARFFIFRESVRYLAPVFLAAGLVTGIVFGIFCEIFTQKSMWYKSIINKREEDGQA